jgi:hypothetical protein
MERHTGCEQIREQLLDLAGPAAAMPAGLNQHLQQCSACTAELAALRRTWAALDDWQAPEPSPYFVSRLQARLRVEKAAPRPSGILAWLGVRWQPALAATLALALVVAIGIFRVTGSQSGASEPPVAATSPAVYDLQNLDKNADVYNNFDMLYDDDQQPSDQ